MSDQKVKKQRAPLAVGLNKGRAVTKRPRRQRSKRKPSQRKIFVRGIIREIAGYSPYERRIMELIKVGLDKRALKVAKRKLGGHKRALHKREEMTQIIQRQKIAAMEKAGK
eukprot:TRINITY_DN816_c0_g1_i1.p1 TRINITY_DN816_c0_g1~~TRINITY_DN816_c0_g1_i1.p1  ORF type:complete len:111 (-),score=19.90 TRINITY_DN816_c0_g1_i1:107-439(-)